MAGSGSAPSAPATPIFIDEVAPVLFEAITRW
jgi:hypothetical protein